jgi:hypothetical protein
LGTEEQTDSSEDIEPTTVEEFIEQVIECYNRKPTQEEIDDFIATKNLQDVKEEGYDNQ